MRVRYKVKEKQELFGKCVPKLELRNENNYNSLGTRITRIA